MAITYIHEATGEQVQKETWRWVAVYDDGSEFKQFELVAGIPVFHQFNEMDFNRVRKLRLEADAYMPVTIIIPLDAKPVHFYRNFNLENGSRVFKYYFIGYELGGHLSLICVDESNRVTLVSNPDDMETH